MIGLGLASQAAEPIQAPTRAAILGQNGLIRTLTPTSSRLTTLAPPSPPSNSPPDLLLTGIVDLLAKKRAFLVRTEHGQAIGSYSLMEGEKRDGLEVLAIDARAETVSVRNAGVEMMLTLKTHSRANTERQLLAEQKMVLEHTVAHQLHEERERARIARERAEAEQLLREKEEDLRPR